MRDTVYSLLRNALKLIRDVRTQSETTSSAGSSFSADAQFKNLEGCIYFLLVQLYIPSGPWKDWASGSSEDTESVDDLGSECGDSLNTDLDDASTRTNSPDLGGSQKPGEGPNSSDGQESDVYKGVSIERKTLLNKSDRSLIKEHRKAHEYSHLDLTIEERCRSALEYTLKCFQFLDSYSFEHRLVKTLGANILYIKFNVQATQKPKKKNDINNVLKVLFGKKNILGALISQNLTLINLMKRH